MGAGRCRAAYALAVETAERWVEAQEGRVHAPDGTELATRRWRPKDGAPPWGSVLIVHGLGEHSGRYDHVGRWLAWAGLDVRAYDQRGFGGSGGPRAYVERWSQLHDDLDSQLDPIRLAGPAPVVLFGHSLGGLVALGYVLADWPPPDLLVLSAPAIEAEIPIAKRLAALVLGRVAPNLRVPNGLRGADLSRDAEVGERYVSDPLNEHRTTTRFGMEALREQGRVSRSLERLAIPTLVVHGTEDRIVPPGASFGLQGRPGVTRRLYSGVRHELHNEPEGQRIVSEIIEWLRERCREASRAADPLLESPDN